MNYNNILIKYIDECSYDEPIFIEEIKDYFRNYIKYNFDNVFKDVYINRLVKENKIAQFIKGIYYKPLKGTFGNKLLNINKVIDKKYKCDNNDKKGYFSEDNLKLLGGVKILNKKVLEELILNINNRTGIRNDTYAFNFLR